VDRDRSAIDRLEARRAGGYRRDANASEATEGAPPPPAVGDLSQAGRLRRLVRQRAVAASTWLALASVAIHVGRGHATAPRSNHLWHTRDRPACGRGDPDGCRRAVRRLPLMRLRVGERVCHCHQTANPRIGPRRPGRRISRNSTGRTVPRTNLVVRWRHSVSCQRVYVDRPAARRRRLLRRIDT
jgi:hypothetical protein